MVISAPLPFDEPARLKALRRYAVLDTAPEASFDRITHLTARFFGTPVALISLIDRKRQWFKSCLGVPAGEFDREIAFCAHAILADDVLVVPDTLEDARFHDNPQVTSAPFIRFYAGAPLVTPDGFRLGTLCIVDTNPRAFSPAQAADLQHFAAMVMEILEARRAAAPMAAAIRSAAAGVVICDSSEPDLPIVFANEAFCASTGYRREEVLGRNCRFLQGPQTDPEMVETLRAAIVNRETFQGTIRNYRKDGTPFWNALSVNPVFDDFGELLSFVSVQVDLTAQVEALEQARLSEARLAVAQQVAHLGSWECRIDDAGKLVPSSVFWSDETYRLTGLAREAEGNVWEHFYRCVHPEDVATVNATFEEAIRHRERYRIDHRLIRPDGNLRVLHEEGEIVFEEATGKAVRIVGTMQDITERKAAEEALRISEENYRALFDTNPLPSWVYDVTTQAFLAVNQAAINHYGYSREEFLAMTLRDLRPPEEVPVFLRRLADLGAGRTERLRSRHRQKDGTLIDMEINAAEMIFGRERARLVVAHDVTERERTERARRESEKQFSGTFAHSPIGTALFTPEGRWLKANPALCRLVGYPEAELLKRSFHDITHPDDLEIGREQIRQMIAGEFVTYQVEKRYLHADGHVITVMVNATLVRDEQGEPSHCVTQIQDISERKQAEAALLESRLFLRSTLDALTSHIAILDEEGTILEVNRGWRYFAQENGFPADSCGVDHNYLKACEAAAVDSAAERAAVVAGIRAVMAGRSETFYLEYPSHQGDRKRWFSVKATRFRMDDARRIVLAHDDITPRKMVEEDLRWKTAFLEAQVNCCPDAILVVDPVGKIILRNPQFYAMWKLPRDLAEGSDDPKQLAWVTGRTKDPEKFVAKVKYLYDHHQETSEDELALVDGMYLERYSAPVVGRDGTHYGRIWTFRDITERKRMEESLRESEARFQLIAANIPGMVYRFMLSADGGVALPFVSQGCRELYGVEPSEMQRDAAAALNGIHPDDRADHQRSIAESAATLMPWNWQGRIVKHGTGEVRYIQCSARPERYPNGDTVWDGIVLDVTDRTRAEENLRAKLAAERTNQEKSRFLSRMSHELRTPLNAILGFGQVLEFSELEEQDAQALSHILKGGHHLLTLIDEVLDLSRAESGELRLTVEKVDAAAVTKECVDLVARLAEARRITCRVNHLPGRGLLLCDEQRLRQMLLNLLSNAIKYNRERGQIFVNFEPVAADRLRINVTDTGAGISPENVARLFVPFERLDYESGEVEGTGLGLVVSRRIAEAMGGSVGVKSEVGRGSTFWIELPLAAAPPGLPTLPVAAPTGNPGGRAEEGTPTGASVLYIEDNLSNIQVVKMLLARCRPHWRFVAERDGPAGLQRAREQPPELILLDLQMPGMHGEEVLAELRRDERTQGIPVIVLSADATHPSRERLLAAGAEAYVSKPFQMDQMLALLDATLLQGQGSVRGR